MTTKRRYGGQTASERRQERRERLIEAAIRLYGRHGYRNTGVRALCKEAGLTERYFYESFTNAEALLEAAFDTAVTRLIGQIRAVADAHLPIGQRACRMLETYYGAIREHRDAARVFLVEITGVSPAIDQELERSLDRFTELILDTHDPQRIGPVAAEPLLRRGIAGGLLHIALAWLEAGYDRSLDEVVAAATPLCLLAEPLAVAGHRRPSLQET